MKKRFLLLVMMALATVGLVNAQQLKRNLVANGNFNAGQDNWRGQGQNNFEFIKDQDPKKQPTWGRNTAIIKVNSRTNAPYESCLYYLLGIKKNIKYKVSFEAWASQEAKLGLEFAVSHAPWTPVKAESWPEGYTTFTYEGNNDWNNLPAGTMRGEVVVTPEPQKYEFITDGQHPTDWGYKFAFCFGHSPVDTHFYIDDVRITQEDGDWDGNLTPYGDFEEGIPPYFGNGGEDVFRIEVGDPNTTPDKSEITEDQPISGNKSWLITKNSGDIGWWDLTWTLPYVGPKQLEKKSIITFKAKSSMPATLNMHLNTSPWGGDFGKEGDIYEFNPELVDEVQTVEFSEETATGGNNWDISAFFEGPSFGQNRWTGIMRFFVSLATNSNGQNWVPTGCKVWIDDIFIREKGLALNSFDVINCPAELKVGATAQLTIANLEPTHADPKVEYEIQDGGTGRAYIDPETGVLEGIAVGTVTVRVRSVSGASSKVSVEIISDTGIAEVAKPAIYLGPSSVKKGEIIEIKGVLPTAQLQIYDTVGKLLVKENNTTTIETGRLAKGVYIVKINDDGRQVSRKFVVM